MTSRAALYLDFDNVFGGLLQLDPGAALSFAEHPREWVDRLATSLLVDGTRRWLVLKCYLNPSGSVANPATGDVKDRLYFSKWRPHFVKAGFEVIDCPPLNARQKNAADLRMALDVNDALTGPLAFDEFVIGSGDSDFTPLLLRVRAAGRRSTVISASNAADAYVALADRLIDGEQALELLATDENQPEAASSEDTPVELPVPRGRDEALSPVEPVARLTSVTNVPRLEQYAWPHVFRALAEYAQRNDYSMTEATKWPRDPLAAQGIEVGRSTFNYVVRGVALGDCPLYRKPPPTADELATAFVKNLLTMGLATSLTFTEGEVDAIFEWFGATRHQD